MTSPITPIPTLSEIEMAKQAKNDAWLAWVISDETQDGERWADFMCAIERHNALEFQREQAALKELSS